MNRITRIAFPFVLAAWSAVAPEPAATQTARVPRPAEVLGWEPGEDRKLPEWAQVVGYFERLDAASPRLALRTIGRTTEGRPMIAAFIGRPETLRGLERLRERQRILADPRLAGGDPASRARRLAALADSGPAVVLVTSSIHSTEVGAILAPLVIAHRLVSEENPDAAAIRDNLLVILVPSLNPDGVDIVGRWYRSTLGTPAEGTSPPVLYHKYVGHDNNRDWYAFTQRETQLVVDSLHNVWHPVIVNDIHQQGPRGARLFIPPYLDPWEPNVDPLLVTGVNALGTAMTWRLTAEGKTGIVNNTAYDAWTPARAYQHYHGGARILTETASARLATPIDVPRDSLRPGQNDDPRVASWNHAAPWAGGRWTLRDIVDYQQGSTWALLASAAGDRRGWIDTFVRWGERALAGSAAAGRAAWPAAWVIPAEQRDAAATEGLLRILQRGGVEVRRAAAAGPGGIAAGDYVVDMRQPYGAFAKSLLERQRYPDLRVYPGGPPQRPYDVTAHTLPLMMGVAARPVPAGTALPALSAPLPMRAAPRLAAPGLTGTGRRVALYRSSQPSMDEGWTRWIFEQYGVPHTVVGDREVRAGLAGRFDVLVVPDHSPNAIERGLGAPYPDSLRGGLGEAGTASVRAFVEGGGTVVAINNASSWAVRALDLPVRDVLAGVPARDFYGPGSILRVEGAADHPTARALGPDGAIWFEEGPAFEVTDSARATALLRYPAAGDPLLSGWLLGAERLHGKAALVEARSGAGRVYLFGFRPQYRAQTLATYPILWAAMSR